MKHVHHIINTDQLADKELLEKLFAVAEKFQSNPTQTDSLHGKILASLFYEPSTRTRFSFEAAMLRLGGQYLSMQNAAQDSSAKKGESLEDTIRTVCGYTDCIVLRHPENGAAQRAAEVSSVPIINAGDGAGEHPTQALLDVYTIQKELGKIVNLSVALVGDCLHSRTIHSLVQLLVLYEGVTIYLVSPPQLRLPKEYRGNFKEVSDLKEVLPVADVVYMTRMQRERFSTKEEYERLKDSYVFGMNELHQLKKTAIVMDPLPRVHTVSSDIDHDNRAAYFRQAQNGLYIRMALLEYLLLL